MYAKDTSGKIKSALREKSFTSANERGNLPMWRLLMVSREAGYKVRAAENSVGSLACCLIDAKDWIQW